MGCLWLFQQQLLGGFKYLCFLEPKLWCFQLTPIGWRFQLALSHGKRNWTVYLKIAPWNKLKQLQEDETLKKGFIMFFPCGRVIITPIWPPPHKNIIVSKRRTPKSFSQNSMAGEFLHWLWFHKLCSELIGHRTSQHESTMEIYN